MRTSSTRRLAAGLSAASLALVFSLGSPAFGGEKSQAGDHGPTKTQRPSSAPTDNDSLEDDGDANTEHPSGKDRHEDKGPQGHSTSDPDDKASGPDRSNGGADKPFAGEFDGSGGVDTQDQDGNNGCGNDDDFEDDNNGNCGGPKKASTPPVEVEETDEEKKPIVIQGSNPIVLGGSTDTAVLASEFQNPAPVVVPAADQVSVLGVQFERTAPAAAAPVAAAAPAAEGSVLGAALARTGMSFTVLALAIALGLLTIGFALKRAGRTTSTL